MVTHNLAAGSVNFGMDSMVMGSKFRSSGGLNPFDASNSQHPLTEIVNEDWNELSNVCGVVVFPHLLQPLKSSNHKTESNCVLPLSLHTLPYRPTAQYSRSSTPIDRRVYGLTAPASRLIT